ncbi:hypothetical protein BC628DRAFT_1365718 [Trametes gibbosa]|nr:hypothetical protein BC628DRAFT_1365718 [Trametes gibbosa]
MASSLDTVLPESDEEYYDGYALHKNIYSHIEREVLPVVSPDACPPLSVMAYAIKNILCIQPPALQLLPALLDLLVHVEIIRTHTVQNLRDLASADQNKRDKLDLLLKPSRLAAQRTVYRKIIDSCCLLHIHHLWRTFDPEKDPPLTTYLIDYFPAFFQVEADPAIRAECAAALTQRPWHHDITEGELEENRRIGAQAVQFVVDAARYADNPEAYCMAHGSSQDTTGRDSFEDLFPPPDFGNIAAVTARFVGRAQLLCETWQSMVADRIL